MPAMFNSPFAVQSLRMQVNGLKRQIQEQVQAGALSYMHSYLPEARPVQRRLVFALARLATLKERQAYLEQQK